ncbi:MAG: hypothetical protein GX883_00400 [Firmicutes bacterium]|nr:hypothetical protein [Bacillota bacterium]
MNKASAEDVLAARLFLRAAFPAMRIPLTEDPKFVKKFENLNLVVEFKAKDAENPLAAHLVFLTEERAKAIAEGQRFKVYEGVYSGAFGEIKVIRMHFKSIESLLGVFKGNTPLEMMGIVPSVLKNMFTKGFFSFLFLMLSLMKMMPDFVPGVDEPFEQYLKVKMSLYMITTAMSRATKSGYEPMVKWTEKQTDRIYQFKVGPTIVDGKEIYPEIGAYLRVKYGQTKAGRGVYSRKSPFVLLSFPNPAGCIAILSGKPFVEAVVEGCVEIIGAGDSYAITFNDRMMDIQDKLVPSKFLKH